MKKKILVLGAGQGGMVAAIKLAEAGYDVTVLEAAKEPEVGYPWYDDIRHDIFDLVGIPEPPREDYCQKSKWIFWSPDNKSNLIVPPLPPMEEIAVSRRGLSKHLIRLAREAGAEVKCGVKVKELLVKKNQVVGAKTSKGKKYEADLVIDASGLRSPFRAQVPKKFHIEAGPKDSEVFAVYRGFFERVPGSPTPDPESVLTLFHMDRCGISWCNLNERDEVDVLIGTFGGQTKAQQKEALADLRERNAVHSDKKIVDRWVDLGVRGTLSVLVADGDAAVGNSAYMTMPFLGSGIEAAMKAGNMLAKAVIDAGKPKGVFRAKDLWPYQVAYFKELGNIYYAIDLAKRWVLTQTPETVNYLLGCGAVTNEDMKLLSTDSSGESQNYKITLPDIVRRIKLITAVDGLIPGLFGALGTAGHGLVIALRMPKKYKARKVRKWQKKYDGMLK
ncbi:MAG: NAD(P)/FAD-dependent oxidoreductase [Clostridia bacterium]|nr:NAD(P)/FAD-dependent oxidoreductase [Clostridia bacterium]